MIEWSDVHLEMRAALRKFLDMQVRPHRHNVDASTPPYEFLHA
ncbi:MAG: hypothetical protein ACRDTV_15550 [Mycobacterium sp.]